MKSIFLFVLLLSSINTFSQTDIIELRSRNASLKYYKRISHRTDADHISSNFGAAPTQLVQTAVLDSVKYLSDKKVVMFTSNYCLRVPRTRSTSSPSTTQPSQKFQHNPMWQPGADTIENHPLFRHHHSLDSVKMVLDRDYNFNLPSDSIRFIGFDNTNGAVNNEQNQQEIQVIPSNQQQKQNRSPFGWILLFTILGPLVGVLVLVQIKLKINH